MNWLRPLPMDRAGAMVVVLAVLALHLAGGSAELSGSSDHHDTCILYQNSLALKGAGRAGHSMLQAWYVQNYTNDRSLVTDSVVQVMRSSNKTVNLTKDGNETVVINVTDNATQPDPTKANKTSVKVNVTANTTDLKVHTKVVKEAGKHRSADTKVEKTESDHKKSDNEIAKEAETAKEAVNRSEPEKPFAKANITVERHTLNITRKMNATHNETQNVKITETTQTVDVATPFHIVWIYIVLFVPVSVAWAAYYNLGQQEHHHVWLLPLTLCTMSVGQDLVNQSLTVILEAPNAISAIQACCMAVAMCIWTLFADREQVQAIPPGKLQRWLGVAVLFAIYQMLNHLVYSICSLSERTVFTNLSPLISLGLERFIMPAGLKPTISVKSRMALSLMVIGALLLGTQSPSFTLNGVGIALLLLLATVPYRLAQRHMLAECPELPLAILACLDGLFLLVPSVAISTARRTDFWSFIATCTEAPVFIMLSLSVVTFIGLHICSLAMLRVSSATTYLVFSNIASIITVALGICFFGDRVLGTYLACIGLFANISSGIWYSAEARLAEAGSMRKKEAETSY